MTYTLWDMDELKKTFDANSTTAASKTISKELYEMIEEANRRHNNKMLQKDIEIAGLKGELKHFKRT